MDSKDIKRQLSDNFVSKRTFSVSPKVIFLLAWTSPMLVLKISGLIFTKIDIVIFRIFLVLKLSDFKGALAS